MTRDHDQSSNSAPATSPDEHDWAVIGAVVGAFGLHGEVKVVPLTDFPARFEHTPTVYLGERHIPYHIERAHPHKRQVLLKLTGVESIDAAEALRGATISIPAADL